MNLYTSFYLIKFKVNFIFVYSIQTFQINWLALSFPFYMQTELHAKWDQFILKINLINKFKSMIFKFIHFQKRQKVYKNITPTFSHQFYVLLLLLESTKSLPCLSPILRVLFQIQSYLSRFLYCVDFSI